jgi:hypothetical protein
MDIDVIFDIDEAGKVNARDLKRLIAEGKILGFRRASGWVMIGNDPVRGDGGSYDGPERRNIQQKGVPTPSRGLHVCIMPDDDPHHH